LWHLQGGIMSPSLPLAVALHSHDYAADPRVSTADLEIFLSNYEPVNRFEPSAIRNGSVAEDELTGKTVLLDAAPPLVAAAAVLPSGQFVTLSEFTAALLANVEQEQTIIAPTWVKALQWLAPVFLAIVAVLFLPDRNRREVLLLATIIIVSLILIDALFLLIMRVRLDIGRALFLFMGASILSWWLVGNIRKSSGQAFERGRNFLAAGRLEPAFAEFRRCEPTEPLATVMYKLSLAFEEQAMPERAEAVIQWMKRTHSSTEPPNKFSLDAGNGTPQRLGRYVIEKKIGKGAMGAVYLAKDPRINRAVALKVIPIEKEFEDEELAEARQRFFREAESAGRLTHPNIITVFDCGEDKHLAYIAMEYLQGISLTEFTNPKRLLAPNKALELCARTAEALDYAHNQGVIHRDIKPANILYSLRQDLLKISDFGVARLTDNNRTKTGIVLGTPMYMSPEQLNAETLTGHSDLFSLGVTLYELLVGEVPFKASNIAVLMTKITTEDPAPVSNRRPGVPPSVDAVLFKALAKRPGDRFTNGGEMAIALRNCAKYAA
jgi:serine/threonine-protein kinase